MSLLEATDGAVAQASHYGHQGIKVLQLQKVLIRQQVRDEAASGETKLSLA